MKIKIGGGTGKIGRFPIQSCLVCVGLEGRVSVNHGPLTISEKECCFYLKILCFRCWFRNFHRTHRFVKCVSEMVERWHFKVAGLGSLSYILNYMKQLEWLQGAQSFPL